MRGRKFLFINLMVNSGGMSTALLTSLQFANMYCISDLSDDNLLAAIDRVKVIFRSNKRNSLIKIRNPNQLQFYQAIWRELVSESDSLDLSSSQFEPIRPVECRFPVDSRLDASS